MDEVAERAGVTKPILYDHFPSKRDLYLALLDEDLNRLHEMIQRALASPEGNRERIRGSFQAYFDFVDAQADGFRLLMQESVGTEKAFRGRVHRFRDQVLREVADLIVRESGRRMDMDRAEAIALALIGMVENVAQRDVGAPPARRRATVETLVELAWRGITELGTAT
jgi:AcrR family transcriptional regulator